MASLHGTAVKRSSNSNDHPIDCGPTTTIGRFHAPAGAGWCGATRYPQRDRAAIVSVSRHGSRTRGNSPSRFGYVSGGRLRRRGTSSSRQGQLALSGNPLKGFRRAFDPILAVVVFRRKLADDLVGAGGGRTRDVARGKIDGRSNGELVFQRPLLLACRQEPLVPLPGPACLYKYRAYITPPPALTSDLTTWQTRRLRESSTG